MRGTYCLCVLVLITDWNAKELELLDMAWASLAKRAWGLTLSNQTAILRLPPAMGGIGGMSAVTLQAKTTVGLVESFRQDRDGEISKLLEAEWGWLTADWGTKGVWEVQLMLMMLDSPREYPTLLSQLLTSVGSNGLTVRIPGLL